MEESGIKMPPKNNHESFPALSRPNSVAELIEIARRLNKVADLSASQHEESGNDASE
jgi:hypothetical protein